MCHCNRIITFGSTVLKRQGRNQGLKVFRHARRLLSSRATFYGWGSSDAGELGSSRKEDIITSPTLLNDFQNFSSVSCGYATTFLYNKNLESAVGFGLNSNGQLGTHGKNGNKIDMVGDILQISCGRSHTLIWSDNGVYVAGSNIQGQCGLTQNYQFIKNFQKVPLPFDPRSIEQVKCGLDHSLILTKEGRIYSSGLGTDGQTGNGRYSCQYGFTPVSGRINDLFVKQISTSTDSCLALTDENTIFGWGNNEQGQISRVNKEKQIACPILIDNLPDRKMISQIGAGGSFSAFVSDGDIFVTGYGALGLGEDTVEVDTYNKVGLNLAHGKIIKVSCGPDYLAALTEKGKLLTWGRGNHGRLGHGNTKDQFTPVMVNLPHRVVEFACGIDHMLAIVHHGE